MSDQYPLTETYGLPEDEQWILTASGLSTKIREVAKDEFGVTVLDVSTGHANLPTTFHVSTDEGVGDLNIRSTTAPEVLEEIRAHFRGETTDPADVPVFEETKPENLPDDGKNAPVAPTIAVVSETPRVTDTDLPANPRMKSDTKGDSTSSGKKGS